MVKSKRNKLSELSVDDFMRLDFYSELSDDDKPDNTVEKLKEKKLSKNVNEPAVSNTKSGKKLKKSTSSNITDKRKSALKSDVVDGEDKNIEIKEVVRSKKSHKQTLENLKENDPGFYNFLQENDQELLDFDDDGDISLSDSSDDSSDEKIEDDVLSEDSAIGEETRNSNLKSAGLTIKIIEKWKQSLESSPNGSLALFLKMKSAIKTVVADATSQDKESVSVVVDFDVFNAVVSLCFEYMSGIVNSLSGRVVGKSLQKASNWMKIKPGIKGYFSTLLTLLTRMTNSSVLQAVLGHTLEFSIYISEFPALVKMFLRKLIVLWSPKGGSDKVQVLSFLCINRILTSRKNDTVYLEMCLKQMYLRYVKETKFVTTSNLSSIVFMQRSLCEVYTMDSSTAYHYGFMYIRQLAIHLRNAMTVRKKDNFQAVYNWQFINCLQFWSRFISVSWPNETIQLLLYPVVQVIIGTLKLITSARFIPLHIHCIRCLSSLVASTDVFVPTIPFVLELFHLMDVNAKPEKTGPKPINFRVTLKFATNQLTDKVVYDGVVNQVYELLLETGSISSNLISFPELVVPTLIELKSFLKTCKIPNYSKQIKQLMDKFRENQDWITAVRSNVEFSVSDADSIHSWELTKRTEGTPLSRFYSSYLKVKERGVDVSENQSKIQGNSGTKRRKNDLKELYSDDDDEKPPLIAKSKKTKKKNKGHVNVVAQNVEISNKATEDILMDFQLSDSD